MLIEIGTIINKYQKQNEVNNGGQILLKTKEVLNRYPAISNYGLNEAIKNGFIPVVKIGKLNYFDVKDIEKYLGINTLAQLPLVKGTTKRTKKVKRARK